MSETIFLLESGYHITLTDQHVNEDERMVGEGLNVYNQSQVGADNFRRLNLYLRDEYGTIVGGLLGATYWGWCAVNVVWMEEALRGQGLGRRLLELAENEARERGCRGMHLDTMSFQALAFYQRLGFTIFGEIEDIPLGHTRFFLKKRL